MSADHLKPFQFKKKEPGETAPAAKKSKPKPKKSKPMPKPPKAPKYGKPSK